MIMKCMRIFSHTYGLIQVAWISYMSNDTHMHFENLAMEIRF